MSVFNIALLSVFTLFECVLLGDLVFTKIYLITSETYLIGVL